MIDNLNRIKRILSARLGAEIPKFLKGNILYHKTTGLPIYSPDGQTWYEDHKYNELFTGNLMEYTKSGTVNKPNSNLMDHISQTYLKVNEIASNIIQNNLNNDPPKPYDLISNPVAGINGVTNLSNYLAVPVEINTDPYGIVENAAALTTSSRNHVDPDIYKNYLTPRRPEPISTIPENIQTREVIPIKDNLKLAKEDRKLYRLSRREIRANDYFEEDAQKGQAFMTGMNTISAVGGVIGAAQLATDSDLTKGISAGYNGVANAVSSLGPYGQVIGGAMKALGTLGDMSQAMGGGTDQMSKLDQWMDSPLLSWNVGMLNGFAGKNSNAFGADLDILAKAGNSYGGTTSTIMDAAESADKKYGLFSWKSRNKANDAIAKAKSQQNLMGDIANTATDQRLAVQSMGEQAGLAYSLMTDGGYNLKYTYAAKEGGILDWNPNISLEWEPQIELDWELPTFKEGGSLEEIEWIPTLQKGNKIRTIEELIEYAKKENPRFIQRLSEEPRGIKFIDDEGNEAEGSHYLESRGEYVIPRIQEINGELKLLSKEDAINRAIETGNYLKMDPEEAIIFAEQYKQGWPEFFKKFKKGGPISNSEIPETEETTLKNVIPEGALHKNKHHMEHAEGLTKKGIPVIDDDGEQQAEIEHSEIIFTLEVTKKLEEYYGIFYSEESSNKEKEQAALDAGKLLVYQILENTEDRTGLIDSCKKGGTLTLKKSTDDLIEELFDWEPTIVIVEEKEVKEQPKNKSEKELIKEAIKEVIIELLTK